MATTKQPVKKWYGSKVTHCQICEGEIGTQFVDGATVMGPWANMCRKCHRKHGVGLGTGRGQLYEQDGADWVKVQG